jgi:RNA polymerase sigma-70 factor (ECF subfamily)
MEIFDFDLSRLRRLEEGEWSKVYRDLATYIFNYAFRRLGGNREKAKDVTQQVFAAAVQGINSYQGDGLNLAGWITGIARNKVYKAARRESLWSFTTDEVERHAMVDTAPLPLSRLIVLEEQELAEAALGALPKHWEEVLRWRYCDELSMKEIGEKLKLSPKSAESLVRRARNGLNKAFLKLSNPPADISARVKESEVL